MATNLIDLKKEVFDYARFRLGDNIIDLELDPEHYETAYSHAVGIYRQRAQNAHDEAYVFLELETGVDTYTLPQEVTEVRQIFRRTFGAIGGTSSNFDPFSSSVANAFLLNTQGGAGSLLTWELYTQRTELVSRMFGGFVNFTFNPSNKRLQLVRNISSSEETVLLWTYNLKPEIQLLTELQTTQWIKDFTYSSCKQMMGEAREKFQSIAGPNGGSSLNGSQLKSEATSEMKELIEDLRKFVDGSDPLSFIIG